MSFSGVIGQDRAVEILKRELLHHRISHAYLFSGGESVGKKRTAMAFAMANQCQRFEGDACGSCPACVKISHETHPDVRVYRPMAKTKGATEKIYIDQIRRLQEEISLCPMEGKKKIFIIDDADRMVEQAANALLKTLEEPPGEALLILISAFPDRLLKTVLSRCRTVRFQPLSESTVKRILMQQKGLSEEEALVMARYSQGSVGSVLNAEEKEILSKRDRFLEWMRGCDLGDIGSIFNVSERFTRNTSEAMEFVEFLLSWTRDLISIKVRGGDGGLLHADKGSDLTEACRDRDLSALLNHADILEEALGRLQMNFNQRLVLEDAFIRMGGE